ncbi:MAG: amino acid ABC transporter permease [Planctomycetes bacterium]|nr:amino acid ABC transporter permease [Planctomycetota bacterium]
MRYHWNFGTVFSQMDALLEGLVVGLVLAVVSLLIGMLIGLVLAFMSTSKSKALRIVAKWYVTVLRNTPLLVLIYIVYFGLPDIKISLGKEESFVFALAIYAGAYMTEVFRAGLEAIPKGLIEAGQAIGLKRLQIRLYIQLPIMFRNVLPSLGNYLISLFKDSSLASAITIAELTYIARKISTITFRVFEVWIVTAIMYVIACYLIAFILRRLERRFALP